MFKEIWELTSTNLDFDFEIGNSDLGVNMKSKNNFQRWEIHAQSGSQIRNSAPDLMDLYVLRFSGKSKKDLF